MALEREIETYQRQLPNLLAHEGKHVVIHGDEVVGYFDGPEDALRAGHERWGLEPFLVRKIRPIEPVYFVPRAVKPCQS